jgi:uroporphyrinogen decarboxylase
MNKRERLERALSGEAPDRVPAALWRHFPGDDARPNDLAAAVIAWQQMFDWDCVTLLPSARWLVLDYGVQDIWDGALNGSRTLLKPAVDRSLDWTGLRALDADRGMLARQLDAVRAVCEALPGVPVVPMIASPLTQAAQLAGPERLIAHLRTQPDRLRTGLNVLTETTLRFIDALKRLPIAGICYTIDYADTGLLAESEYLQFGLPEDQRIMTLLPPKWWLNIVSIAGRFPYFKVAASLPVQVVNWHDQASEITLASGKSSISGAVCGGLDARAHLHDATPSAVRQAARSAIESVNGRRIILGAGGPTWLTTPWSNLRAVREAVEGL